MNPNLDIELLKMDKEVLGDPYSQLSLRCDDKSIARTHTHTHLHFVIRHTLYSLTPLFKTLNTPKYTLTPIALPGD